MDLADLESVRKFVDDFHETGKKLHTLINNAGMVLNSKDAKRQYTNMNFELTAGTNHLGKFFGGKKNPTISLMFLGYNICAWSLLNSSRHVL